MTEDWVIGLLRDEFDELAGARVCEGGVRVDVPMAALDDCAVLSVPSGARLAVSTDYVRGREFDLFRLGWLTYFDLGYYLIAANLSDLAAMGASPVGVNLVLRYAPDMSRDDMTQLVRGVAASCRSHGGCAVLGGDTGGATDLVLAATVLGVLPSAPLLRSNARPGDAVYLCGYAGRAGAVRRVLAKGLANKLTDSERDELLSRWRRPSPKLVAGQSLAATEERIACQDTSDGVKTAIRQIAAASGVKIVVNAFSFPMDPLVSKAAAILGDDPLAVALGASPDFGLVVVAPRSIDVTHVVPCGDHPVVEIGSVVQGTGAALRRADGGVIEGLPGEEYRQ